MTNEFKPGPYGLVDSILIPHTSFQSATSRIEQCFRAMQQCADPICLALVGESRTGKSRSLENFERQHLPTRAAGGRQVPFLRVKVPSKPTVKALATLLLYALGDPAYNKDTEVNKTLRLYVLLKGAGTVVLALDEFQHFLDKTTHAVQHHVADWLKVLVDETKIGLIVTGLPSCMSVIEQNEQLAGRFMAPIHLPRFDWRNPEHGADFAGVLEGMGQALSAFEWPKLDDEAVVFRFYCATGGLIGYLTKLLKQATWNALDAGCMRIGLPELAVAYREALVKDDPVLQQGFNPFEREFNLEASDEIMAFVRSIGVQKEEPARPPRSTHRAPKLAVHEVLVT